LNQLLLETRQAAEKKEVQLKSQLESSSSTIKELEVLLAANSTKTKLEKAAMNELHRQTVKV